MGLTLGTIRSSIQSQMGTRLSQIREKSQGWESGSHIILFVYHLSFETDTSIVPDSVIPPWTIAGLTFLIIIICNTNDHFCNIIKRGSEIHSISMMSELKPA